MPNKLHRCVFPFVVSVICAAFSADAANAPTCQPAQRYEGPAQIDVPASVWQRDFTRSIDGELNAELVAQLDAALAQTLQHYPAVSAAVAIPGEGLWFRTRGDARKLTAEPVNADSLFQVASITKALTAAVTLQLVQEKKLQLTRPVRAWFPDVPEAALMTIGQLLNHTGGLVSFNALPNGLDLGERYRAPAELIAIAAEYPLQFCPGQWWAYTNTGYVLLGRIIEAVESKPLAQVFSERIYQPLSLTHTLMRAANTAEPHVVYGHERGQPSTSPIDYAMPFAGGSLASNARDMVRFWHALLSGKLLPLDTVRASFTGMYPMQPLIPAPPNTHMYYGRGVQFTDTPGGNQGPGPMLSHDGGMPGFNATLAYLIEDDAYIAVLVNDKVAPAAAGLWLLARTLREFRTQRDTLKR